MISQKYNEEERNNLTGIDKNSSYISIRVGEKDIPEFLPGRKIEED